MNPISDLSFHEMKVEGHKWSLQQSNYTPSAKVRKQVINTHTQDDQMLASQQLFAIILYGCGETSHTHTSLNENFSG